jgi:hypothetical protein
MPAIIDGRTDENIRCRSLKIRKALTSGISTICDPDGLLTEYANHAPSVLQKTIAETMTNAPKAMCAFTKRPLSLSVIKAVFMIMQTSEIGFHF